MFRDGVSWSAAEGASSLVVFITPCHLQSKLCGTDVRLDSPLLLTLVGFNVWLCMGAATYSPRGSIGDIDGPSDVLQ